MVAFPKPDSFHEYQVLAALTDRGSGRGKPSFAALGLFGEAGSVLAEVKKLQRDSIAFKTYYETVLEELGDTLWYLSTIASRAGVRLDDVAQDAAAFFNPKFVSNPVRFDDLERVGLAINFEPSTEYELALRKLGTQVGAILDEDLDGASKDQITALLAMALHYLIDVSFQCGVHLRDVASHNVEKHSAGGLRASTGWLKIDSRSATQIMNCYRSAWRSIFSKWSVTVTLSCSSD